MKSRVVEALCLLLCEKFPQSRREVHAGKPSTTSRWKLILSEYNSVRARLLNSQALLEGTNLMLYAINETTLIRWHKNSVRRDEIRLLMQGLSPPQPQFTTDTNSLPPAKSLLSGPGPSPLNPHSFPEAEDTTGQARVRKRKDTTGTLAGSTISPAASTGTNAHDTCMSNLSSLSSAPGPSGLSSAAGPSGLSLGADPSGPTSRTTAWRRKREREQGQRPRERKEYSCRICNRPMTTPGHTQFYGQRYCPDAPGQLPQEEWLRMKKQERDRKKQQGPDTQ